MKTPLDHLHNMLRYCNFTMRTCRRFYDASYRPATKQISLSQECQEQLTPYNVHVATHEGGHAIHFQKGNAKTLLYIEILLPLVACLSIILPPVLLYFKFLPKPNSVFEQSYYFETYRYLVYGALSLFFF